MTRKNKLREAHLVPNKVVEVKRENLTTMKDAKLLRKKKRKMETG